MEPESHAAPPLESHLAPVELPGSRRSLSLPERIRHTNRPVLLAVRKVFRIQYLCPRCLCRLNDKGVPERDLITPLKVKGFQDRVAAIHDDLPRQVVGDDLTSDLGVEWSSGFPTEINGELL